MNDGYGLNFKLWKRIQFWLSKLWQWVQREKDHKFVPWKLTWHTKFVFNFSVHLSLQIQFHRHYSCVEYAELRKSQQSAECVRNFSHPKHTEENNNWHMSECYTHKCQVSQSGHFQLRLLSVGHLVKQFCAEHIFINF